MAHVPTIEKVQVRRHTGAGSTRSVWKCAKCDYTSNPMTALNAAVASANHEAQWEHVAEDRLETEPCQKGTVGCCIDHKDHESDCEGW